jgi:hypothetical protein
VIVYTHHDPQLLRREAARIPIHRIEQIKVFAPAAALIQNLVDKPERNASWDLVRSGGGRLYVTQQGVTFVRRAAGALARTLGCSSSLIVLPEQPELLAEHEAAATSRATQSTSTGSSC